MLKRGLKSVVLYLILVAPGFAHQAADSDEKLASDFWSWRGRYAQYTGDDVTRMERPAGVVRAAMPKGAKPFHQGLGVDAFDGRLGGRVNIQHVDRVGLMKCAREIVHQRFRSGVAVRLK